MLRMVPPAGAPLELSQIFHALRSTYANETDTGRLLGEFTQYLRVRHVIATCSGRSGLYATLRALRSLRPDRGVVAVPAYVCFSVPASIVRAGLVLQPVDVDPETLDYNFTQLESLQKEGLLCILGASLFGLVNDAPRIQAIAHAKGAFFLDDAAQALGASRDGRLAGTAGDAGLYSFGRGKVLANLEGGLIVTGSDEIAAAVEREVDAFPAASPGHDGRFLLQLLAYSALLNPRLYWIPASLPFLGLGVTEYKVEFPATRASKFSLALSHHLLAGLEEVARSRQRNAAEIAGLLRGHPKFTMPGVPEGCIPSFIRFPLIARDEATREKALAGLRAAGIGASPFYPSAICDIAGIENYMAEPDFHRPQAESLARRLLTLPTHPGVTRNDLERIRRVLWSF
jgi:perosamine synthetase